jgi:hypothetical protein
MVMELAAVKALDAKALSEVALTLCGVGALGVWIGLRFDRYLFRWAGMTVIVVGLLGLIFQNSLSRQTQAADLVFPTAPSTSPSPSLTAPTRSPSRTKKPQRKPTHKPTRKPPPPPTGGGGFTPPPSKPPSQPPLPPIKGSPLPP